MRRHGSDGRFAAHDRRAGNVLVTGASGFLGSRLVRELARRPATMVYALTRRRTRYASGRIVPLVHDLTRPLARLRLPARLDLVLHCASPWGDVTDPEALLGVNVRATHELLAYASRAGARRFVFVSSGGVTGYARDPIREDAPLAPPSPYLMAKAAGELVVRAHAGAVASTIIRPFFVYGPGQRHGLLRLLCERLSRSEPILVGRGGAPALNPIHVRDAVRLILRIVARSDADDIVNVAGPETVSIRELAEDLARRLALRPLFRRDPGRRLGLEGDTRRLSRYGHCRVRLAAGLAELAGAWRAASA